MKVAEIRTMSLFSRVALILFLCAQVMASGAQAQSLGDEDDFWRISKLIEQQNIEVAFEEVKELKEGKSKLSAQSQALMGLIYLELAQPAKAFSFFEKVTFSSTEMDHIAEAGMAKAELMLGNLSQARDLAESAYKRDPDELLTKVALASAFPNNCFMTAQINYSKRQCELVEKLSGRAYVRSCFAETFSAPGGRGRN